MSGCPTTKTTKRTTKRATIITRLQALGCLCADGCQGRCRECPDDVIADAINEIGRLYEAGYEHARRDAVLVIRHHAKARMTAGHVRMMASEVEALEPPDPSLRVDLMESTT
jgi:hypothetical protein